MEITYLGDSSFKIRGKSATVVTSETPEVSGKTVAGPGEYEIMGVSIIGIPAGKSTIYVYEMDGLRLAHLSDLGKSPTDATIEQIGDIDILIFQGGDAVEIIQEIEPYFVVTNTPLSEAGLPVERLPKFQIKKEDILEDQNPKMIILERHS